MARSPSSAGASCTSFVRRSFGFAPVFRNCTPCESERLLRDRKTPRPTPVSFTPIVHPRAGATMPTIRTRDGVDIFYKDWGAGQPIVFSHGWPLSADDWDTQMLFF